MFIHQYNSRNHHSRKSVFKPLQKSLQHEPSGIIDEPIGIAPTEANSGHTWHYEQSDDDTIDTSAILDILQASLSQLFIYRTMKSKADTTSPLWKYIRFLPKCYQAIRLQVRQTIQMVIQQDFKTH